MCQRFVDKKEGAISIYLVNDVSEVDLTSFQENWLVSQREKNKAKGIFLVPDENGKLEKILWVAEDTKDMWIAARLAENLPAQHTYVLESATDFLLFSLAWGMACYRFDEYKTEKTPQEFPLLFVPQDIRKEADALISAIFLVRDLINTPANDLTPRALASKAEEIGNRFKARTKVVTKEALAEQFPMVHAVGQASINAPAVVDMEWGNPKNPSVALIGKGVTFDTGGLDVKPPSNMFLMKKDMGGAAHALALAQLIMEMDLPIHLRLILPCAENSIGSNAYRPSDVLTSRKGLTVEVSDTDAEGRLLLADALTAATEKSVDYTVDFATLTGAARVAVGTEIAAYFTDDEQVSQKIKEHGDAQNDGVWALPLWQGYEDQLPSSIADLKSCSSGGYGGAITAALFLKKFLVEKTKWAHFDEMGWNIRARPGRPIGGEAMGLRAMYAFFKDLKA